MADGARGNLEINSLRRDRPVARNLAASGRDHGVNVLRTILVSELSSHVGTTFRSPPITIDAALLASFERGTLIDVAYKDSGPAEYGDDLIPGFMSLALFDALSVMTVRFEPARYYAINYGLDRVRFVSPLRVGDTVHAEIALTSVAPQGDGTRVTQHAQLHTCDSRVAVDAVLVVLILPRAIELEPEKT